MGSEVSSDTEQLALITVSTPCGIADYNVVPRVTHTFERCWNDLESRVLPVDLIGNPTPLQLQYTQEEYRQLEKKLTPTCSWCTIDGVYACHTGWRIDRNSFIVDINFGDHILARPETNWELDMRLRIKERLVNLGESLAEFRESASLVSNFALTLIDIYKSARKGKLSRKLRRALRSEELPGHFLMARFGLSPLLNDVSDSLIAMQLRFQRPIYQRFRVTREASDTAPYYGGHVSRAVSQRAVVHVQLHPRAIDITFGNIAENAWALVPFSFIVDQIVPIGDYLSSLDALDGITFKSGTLTTKERREFLGKEPVNSGYFVAEAGHGYQESHERLVLTGIPMASFPDYRPSRSLQAVMNDLAVLYQVRRSFNQRR